MRAPLAPNPHRERKRAGPRVKSSGSLAVRMLAALLDRAGRCYCRAMAARPPRRTYFWILPVAVFGSSSTKWKSLRGLEVGHVVAGELAQLVIRWPRRRLEHDERVRRLAPALVRQPDDGDLLDGRVADQDALDLDGGDVLAAADDDVLEAVADLGVAVRVDHGRVAGVEPAVADRGGRGVRVVVVALHHDVAAHDDLAESLAVVRDLVALLVHDPQLAGGDQLDALAGFDGGAGRPARARRARGAARRR